MKKRLFGIALGMCLIGATGCGGEETVATESKTVNETVSAEEAKFCIPDSNVRLDADADEIFNAYNVGKEPLETDDLMFESQEPISIYGKEYRFFVFLNEDGGISSISASMEAKGASDADLEELKQNMEKVYGETQEEDVYTWRVYMPDGENAYNIKIEKVKDQAYDLESVNIRISNASSEIALEKSESELAEKMEGVGEAASEFIEDIYDKEGETEAK